MGRAKKPKNLSETAPANDAGDDETPANPGDDETPAIPSDVDKTLTIVRVQAGETAQSNSDYIQDGIIDGRYQILSILGKGGMGTVFLAKHLVLNRIRAVKVLHPHLCSDGNAVIRFRNEAAAVSALEHANIIAVHDSGATAAGTPYIAMDFVEGDSLSQLIQDEGALPVVRALPIFHQVAEALSHAHEKGIVHRDLKPSNILIVNSPDRKDFVKVVDFGIAKILPQENSVEQKLTQTGDIFGSPLYMSPEQCMGGKLDERSDIYSLGCLMHEALTGSPPFVGNTAYETFLKHMNETPPGLKSAVKDRSTRESLEVILFAALTKEPEKRYQSMRQLADHMKLVEEGMHRGLLAQAKNWWYLKQLKRGPQKKAIPFGRFVAAMTLAICFSLLSIFLFVDLARDEPLDYYQTLLWSKIIPQPQTQTPSPVMQRKMDRAKQVALAMMHLSGGVDANQDNVLRAANNLMKFGRFNEAATFYRDLLKAQLKETNNVKKYYMASTFHDYGDSLLYINDLNGAESAYLDEVETLKSVKAFSEALLEPLSKLAAIHAQQKAWRQLCEDYESIDTLRGKKRTNLQASDQNARQRDLLPLDLCRFGEAQIQAASETQNEAEIAKRHKRAQELFVAALDTLRKSGSATRNDYYVALVGIARTEAFFGNKQKATEFFRDAVKQITTDSASGAGVDRSVVYTNYADFCRAQGNYLEWIVWRTKVALERLFH